MVFCKSPLFFSASFMTKTRALLWMLPLALASCGGSGVQTMNLMPAPAAYTETGLPVEKWIQGKKVFQDELRPIFYATDRARASSGDEDPVRFYNSDRGGCVRLGRAAVVPASKALKWADAWRNTFSSSEARSFPIKVGGAEEYGVLGRSVAPFQDLTNQERDGAQEAGRRYAREINEHLAKTNSTDIHIYVHGYRTMFESPLLTTAELWHFTGNQDVFIAYSWPATPKALAYISDSETTHASSRHLRAFLRFLAEETKVRRINLIGYSAGSRLVTRALDDLALQEKHRSPVEARKRLKLGTVSILAGDVDRGIFGGYLADGILDIVDHLIVYQNSADIALIVPRLLTGFYRSGESIDPKKITPRVRDYLLNHPKLALVDVSTIDSARKGNGHSYLRGSPWVSTDLLLYLLAPGMPNERGLVRYGDNPIWHFPPDYVERLRKTLIRLDPSLAE
jgi:esterase/lipase superfamily enzyme